MAKYGVVHTTNIRNPRLYDFQSTVDVENGTLIAKGNVITDERNIYAGEVPTADTPVYLVANPAWDYDECRVTNQNEDQFINEKDRAYRVYGLCKNDRYRVTDYSLTGTVAVGSYVDFAHKVTTTASATSAYVGKIVAIDDIGFAYAVGSAGNVGAVAKMALIEVVRNEPVPAVTP